jgi:iron only hydrogenase large subunit-like protein
MFSGIVKIADIDDYITPSQNCIKPISENDNNKTSKSNKITLESYEDITSFKGLSKPDLIKLKDKNTKTAKVSLSDCLACNGCVTTAETLLIQAQSVDEFLKNTSNSDNISIVCISPQSVLSLAYYYKISDINAMELICKVLQNSGVQFVFNFDNAVALALELAYLEWIAKSKDYIICSECPGWICYAEKKIGEWVIPYLSKVKAPQQLYGHIIKTLFKRITNKRIYLSCIMPCFDKKLEASRESHKIEDNILEVDTVISTNELIELFDKLNIKSEEILTNIEKEGQNVFYNFSTLNEKIESGVNSIEELKNNYYYNKEDFKVIFAQSDNFSSNCYAEYIMTRYIKDNNLTNYKIERKTIKNNDFRELNLWVEDKGILSFALVYGFRNIQNILRNKNKIKYSYIEIMACPGGCINGGGQMRSRTEETARDVLKNIEEGYLKGHGEEFGLKEMDINVLQKYFKDSTLMFTEYRALDTKNMISLKW